MPDQVLIVSDDAAGADEALLRAFARDGYAPVAAAGPAEGWKRFESLRPALLVVCLGDKPRGGLGLCSKVRAHPSLSMTPVAVLSEDSSLEGKRRAFTAGADLFMGRPVDEARLLISVKALLRRARSDEDEGGVLRAEDFVIDPRSKTVKTGAATVRDLTKKEFALLYELVRRRPKTLSKEFIMGSLWKSVLRDNTIEVHVWSLRKKLGPAGARVVTVPKSGYRFV